MTNRARFTAVVAATLLMMPLVGTSHAASTAGSYHLVKTLNIGGPGRWDYATMDAPAHRLFVTRSTHTQAIDVNSGNVVLDIKGQQRAHGVAIDAKLNRGFISDGKAGDIVIFNLKTGEVLGHAKSADDCDGIIYDAGSDRVLAACGDAGQLAVLNPHADPKSAKAQLVELGGKPEFLAADGKGNAYVNISNKSKLAVVDIKSMKVTATYSLGSGKKPSGLAIDPASDTLFIGCRNKLLIVMHATDGKVLAALPIGSGNDACDFDPGTGAAFASCADGTTTMVKANGDGKYEVAQTIKTLPGARTMALDPGTHALYLPTAEFGAKTAGRHHRPSMKPGSFRIAVVAPQ